MCVTVIENPCRSTFKNQKSDWIRNNSIIEISDDEESPSSSSSPSSSQFTLTVNLVHEKEGEGKKKNLVRVDFHKLIQQLCLRASYLHWLLISNYLCYLIF